MANSLAVRPMLRSTIRAVRPLSTLVPKRTYCVARPPSTLLSDDERILRDTVRKFAEEEVMNAPPTLSNSPFTFFVLRMIRSALLLLKWMKNVKWIAA